MKRRAFSSFNPSGATIQMCLAAAFLVGAGIYVFGLVASCLHRSSLECHRAGDVVACKLRKSYPGAMVSTDRFQLRSAAVERRSYSIEGSSESYRLLVLNSELELPSHSNAPDALAAQLNDLLDGKATSTGTIPLKNPSYGNAALLTALAAFTSGIGAVLLWVAVSGGRRSNPAHD